MEREQKRREASCLSLWLKVGNSNGALSSRSPRQARPEDGKRPAGMGTGGSPRANTTNTLAGVTGDARSQCTVIRRLLHVPRRQEEVCVTLPSSSVRDSKRASFSSGPEDFDSEGRCSRCLGKGIKCERETPVRKPGGNPHKARSTLSASPYPSPSRPNRAVPASMSSMPSQSHAQPSTSTAPPAYFANGSTDAGQLELLSDAAVLGGSAGGTAQLDAVAMQPWQQVIGFHDPDPTALFGLPPPSTATAPFDWSFLSSLPDSVSSPSTAQSPVDRLLAQEASLNLDPNLPEGLTADMTAICESQSPFSSSR